MARARTLVLDTKVKVTGADELRSLGRTLQTTGRNLTIGITTPLTLLAGAATTAASDLNESVNAINVVFGDAADKIEAYGETAAEAAGLSRRSFNQLVTPIGAMLRNVGFAADEAADSSINLAQRAADMASVFNTDVSEALGAIQAGLRGEVNPLERFGVSLTAAAVNAHALELGLADLESELTANDKAHARLSLIMEQTNQLAGDFANTVGEAANQERIMAAEAENAAAALGQKLLPIKRELIRIMSDLLDSWNRLPPAMQDNIIIFAGVAAAVGPVLVVVGTLVRALGPLIRILPILSRALGVSRLALLGWIGAITAAGLAVGQQYGDVLEGLSGQILRDFARQHGIAADQVTRDVARIAESLGVDIPEAQERLLAGMDGNAEAYDRVVRGLVDSTNAATGDISEALLGAGSDWEDYQNQISGAMFDEPDGAVPTIGMAADAMADEMGEAPGKMADELLANQFELTDATTELVTFMEQAISPAQEMMNAQAFLASQELADGLNSGIPSVVLKAEEMRDEALAVLNFDASAGGASSIASWVNGMSYEWNNIQRSRVLGMAGAAGRIFGQSLPTEGPLAGGVASGGYSIIESWFSDMDRAARRGMGTLTGIAAAAGAALVTGSMTDIPRASAVLGGAGGAGVTNITNINLHWDGPPPQGRTEEEIIGNLQRLSPLVGNALVGGS